jgi:hypothetical protein
MFNGGAYDATATQFAGAAGAGAFMAEYVRDNDANRSMRQLAV